MGVVKFLHVQCGLFLVACVQHKLTYSGVGYGFIIGAYEYAGVTLAHYRGFQVG